MFPSFSLGHDARHHGRFDQKDSLAAALWPHSRRLGNGMCTVSVGMIQYTLCSLRLSAGSLPVVWFSPRYCCTAMKGSWLRVAQVSSSSWTVYGRFWLRMDAHGLRLRSCREDCHAPRRPGSVLPQRGALARLRSAPSGSLRVMSRGKRVLTTSSLWCCQWHSNPCLTPLKKARPSFDGTRQVYCTCSRCRR